MKLLPPICLMWSMDLDVVLGEEAETGGDRVGVAVPDAVVGVLDGAFDRCDGDRLQRLQHRHDLSETNLDVDEGVGLRVLGDQVSQSQQEAGLGDILDDDVMTERLLKAHDHQGRVVNLLVLVPEDVLPRHLNVVEDGDGVDLFETARDWVIVG